VCVCVCVCVCRWVGGRVVVVVVVVVVALLGCCVLSLSRLSSACSFADNSVFFVL
jgi:hypothetical protein